MARSVLEEALRKFIDNVRGISLEETLDAAGGYRSVLVGLMKHVATRTAVNHSGHGVPFALAR